MALDIKILSKDRLKKHLKETIRIDQIQMRIFGKWTEENFLLNLPLKFQLSSGVFLKNKLIGYCVASKGGRIARIHRIAVSPEYAGQSIGHTMIKFLKQTAKKHKCQKIIAETLKNIKSNSFYLKEGFKRLNLAEQKKYALKVYINEKLKLRHKFMKSSYVFELKI